MNDYLSLSKKNIFYSEAQILFCQRGIALYLFFHYYSILQTSFITFRPIDITQLNIILALTCLLFLNLFTRFFAFLCWIFCTIFLFNNTYLYGINHDYVGFRDFQADLHVRHEHAAVRAGKVLAECGDKVQRDKVVVQAGARHRVHHAGNKLVA